MNINTITRPSTSSTWRNKLTMTLPAITDDVKKRRLEVITYNLPPVLALSTKHHQLLPNSWYGP